jgi:nucleoside-diphosphate-sugar epimerase
MSNLIIGDTSQLSHFFPKNYERISSRNINFEEIKKKQYDRIYLLFAEQRTFMDDDIDLFKKINFDYTIEVIDELIDFCENIVIYSTSELWNKYDGCVSINNEYDYNETPYIKSKEMLCNYINNNKDRYKKVIIIYPFNFNSVYRKGGFLFGKIYKSLLLGQKISIGDVDFERDLIHPKIIVDESIKTKTDIIVGSGELFNVKKFIIDIFNLYNKNFDEYILIESKHNLKNKRNGYYSCKSYSTYNELLELSVKDLYEYKIS